MWGDGMIALMRPIKNISVMLPQDSDADNLNIRTNSPIMIPIRRKPATIAIMAR
jgi:hypothetical protein